MDSNNTGYRTLKDSDLKTQRWFFFILGVIVGSLITWRVMR